MSHKYQVKLNYPENFQFIIKNFTREVLRHQPKNIYEFGLEYFTNLANMEERSGGLIFEERGEDRGMSDEGQIYSENDETQQQDQNERIHEGNELGFESVEQLVDVLLRYTDAIDPDDSFSIVRNTKKAIQAAVPNASTLQMLFALSFFREKYETMAPNDGYVSFITEAAGPALFNCLQQHTLERELDGDLERESIKNMPAGEFQNEIRIILDRSGTVEDGYIASADLHRTLKDADVDFSDAEIAVIIAGSEDNEYDSPLSVESLVESIPVLCYYAGKFETFKHEIEDE